MGLYSPVQPLHIWRASTNRAGLYSLAGPLLTCRASTRLTGLYSPGGPLPLVLHQDQALVPLSSCGLCPDLGWMLKPKLRGYLSKCLNKKYANDIPITLRSWRAFSHALNDPVEMLEPNVGHFQIKRFGSFILTLKQRRFKVIQFTIHSLIN